MKDKVKHLKITFPALMKELNVKSLVSGDKGARVTLEIDNPSDELIASINALMKSDEFVHVTVANG